ncbi:MAG: hypothetical protein ACREPP_04120, partial [Rhodanobacteraceae bacterium]
SLARLDGASVRRALIGLAQNLQERERDQLKGALAAMVERIELDPASFACRIHYRIRAGTHHGLRRIGGGFERVADASPWGRHFAKIAGGCCICRSTLECCTIAFRFF